MAGSRPTIEFRAVHTPNRPTAVMPVVDGVTLCDLVGAYERERGYEPSGAYGGLVPAFFDYGRLTEYLRGDARQQCPEPGSVWLLACDCGEVGCWPLEADVAVTPETVTWSGFRQPYRLEWSYAAFGPFVFDGHEYDAATAHVTELIEAELGQEVG